MIPEVLHFVWLDLGSPFPEKYKKSLLIATRNTRMKVVLHTNDEKIQVPGVEIRLRTFETDFNNHKFDKEKDYIANITEITRLEILYNEGGVYSDLDVYWLKHPWHLLHHSCFIGYDNKAYKILCNAVIGAEAGHQALKQYRDWIVSVWPPKKYWGIANPYKLWKDRTDVVMVDKFEFFPVRWTKMNNVTMKHVEKSTALHLYDSFKLPVGGEFITLLNNYLNSVT